MSIKDSNTQVTEWWNDPVLVYKLEKEYEAWDAGKEHGYTFPDIQSEILRLRLEKKLRNHTKLFRAKK